MLSRSSLLCVIIDKGLCGDARAASIARQAASAGADMIQLRDKGSSAAAMLKTAMLLRRITARYGIPLIINDRPDVAVASGSDGVHIGRCDISIAAVRKLIGSGKLVGVSVHTVAQARQAARQRASYIGAGPVFATPLKKGRRAAGIRLLGRLRRFSMPVVAIGGINQKNISRLTGLGFNKVAVIRAVMNSRDPFGAARRLKEALT